MGAEGVDEIPGGDCEMSSERRVFISPTQADELMPEGERVHTFMQAHGQPGLVLLGADRERSDLLDLAKDGKVELAGEEATKMKHGLVAHTEHGWVFIATK